MIKMISTWDQKEYEIPEFTDFLPIIDFTEKRFGMNFYNYTKTRVDTRAVYNAMSFTIRACRKLDKLNVLSNDDIHARELMNNFIDHVPVSGNDAMTECTTKESAYTVFDCPILSNKQMKYYVNSWNENFKSFYATMDNHLTTKSTESASGTKAETETVTVDVPKYAVAPTKKNPNLKVVKINFDTESIGLDPIYGHVGRIFTHGSKIKVSENNPKLYSVTLDANDTYKISFGNCAENAQYIQMTGKEIAANNQACMKARRKAWAAAQRDKRETAAKTYTSTKKYKRSNTVMLSLGKSRIKPVKEQSDRMGAVIGLKLDRTIFGQIQFDEQMLKSSDKNNKIVYLPLSTDSSYSITVKDYAGKESTLMLTGTEIVNANKAYMTERRQH